jgi:hypothetical protein
MAITRCETSNVTIREVCFNSTPTRTLSDLIDTNETNLIFVSNNVQLENVVGMFPNATVIMDTINATELSNGFKLSAPLWSLANNVVIAHVKHATGWSLKRRYVFFYKCDCDFMTMEQAKQRCLYIRRDKDYGSDKIVTFIYCS